MDEQKKTKLGENPNKSAELADKDLEKVAAGGTDASSLLLETIGADQVIASRDFTTKDKKP